jgi:hypothetical protein
MGHPPPSPDVGRMMASRTLRTHLKGLESINLVVLVVLLLLDGDNFLVPWRGCFRARSRRATGGDVLLLSVGFPSKQE